MYKILFRARVSFFLFALWFFTEFDNFFRILKKKLIVFFAWFVFFGGLLGERGNNFSDDL